MGRNYTPDVSTYEDEGKTFCVLHVAGFKKDRRGKVIGTRTKSIRLGMRTEYEAEQFLMDLIQAADSALDELRG